LPGGSKSNHSVKTSALTCARHFDSGVIGYVTTGTTARCEAAIVNETNPSLEVF
jgi:hypothetical protein